MAEMTKAAMEKERKDKPSSIINKKDPWFQGFFLLLGANAIHR
jgi:hypothetical protein